ncbi:nuclear transport factor 2 family protein [Nocardia sp. NPDC059228]|uniref:nuclear transport factor 2 family protein n=1 Tax=Nocardia sp. NPDC059228 TaxID=3346777 RepID=UPI0036A7946D
MTDTHITDTAAANRRLVTEAMARFAAGDHAVLADVLAEDFIEHSPDNPSGREAFIAHITNAPVARAHLEIARVIADHRYVVVHYRMDTGDRTGGDAVADIWRLDDGRITEHWDVVQPVPDPERTPNGMF